MTFFMDSEFSMGGLGEFIVLLTPPVALVKNMCIVSIPVTLENARKLLKATKYRYWRINSAYGHKTAQKKSPEMLGVRSNTVVIVMQNPNPNNFDIAIVIALCN